MKHLKFLILFFLSAFLLIGCFSRKQTVQLQLNTVKEYTLPVHDFDGQFRGMQLINDSLLAIGFRNGNIPIYNLHNNTLVNELTKYKRAHLNMFAYNIINWDSIYVFNNFSMNICPKQDSTLLIINAKNELKKAYLFNFINLVDCEKGLYEYSYYFHLLGAKPLILFGDKVFLLLDHPDKDDSKFDTSYNNAISLGALMDINTSEITPIKGLQYPFLNNYSYPEKYKGCYISASHNGNPILSFRYTSLFYEYDIKTEKLIPHYFKSDIIDTIYPNQHFKNPEAQNQFILGRIMYNPANKTYYRTAFKDSSFVLSMFDTTYNMIAEGVSKIPLTQYIFRNNHIIAIDYPKTISSEHSIYLNEYEITFSNKKVAEKVASTKKLKLNQKKDIKHFLKEHHINKNSNQIVLILPTDYSCDACLNSSLNFCKLSEEALTSGNFNIIYVADNKMKLAKHLKETKMTHTSIKSEITNLNSYNNYHTEKYYNPRLIVIKDKEVVLDKIYNPSEMQEMQMNIDKYYHLFKNK